MGALDGIAVVEFAAIGPVPFCAMLLAEHGAAVTRVERPGGSSGSLPPALANITTRGRRTIAIDLKRPAGVEVALDLVDMADVLVEGHRPGVMERLGLGPDVCLDRNPRLVYGRMTGFGQEGPMAQMAGHDIDYIAMTGALDAIGTEERPVPPLNLLGDYGGGAMYLAFGVLAALVDRAASGLGQVVDAAMVDGAASLMTPIYELAAAGMWRPGRRTNLLDGGAPFYDTYECADGGWVAVGPLEPPFLAVLLDGLGLAPALAALQMDPERWAELRAEIAARFRSRPRDDWADHFAGTDACVAPVLSLEEAPAHPANVARGVFREQDGKWLPAPAPRLGRTPPAPTRPGSGSDFQSILEELGRDAATIAALHDDGVVA